MHAEAYAFVMQVAQKIGEPREGLELGSYNVNGSAREELTSVTSWYGIDRRPGPNVDEVADAETWKPKKRYDLVLCTEVLEHATHPDEIVKTAFHSLRRGGFFIMTCAAPGRTPHSDDGVHDPALISHYENVSSGEMYDWLEKAGFEVVAIEVNHRACDLYSLARRP
jgi:predicted SAM-dependent methyltransferase